MGNENQLEEVIQFWEEREKGELGGEADSRNGEIEVKVDFDVVPIRLGDKNQGNKKETSLSIFERSRWNTSNNVSLFKIKALGQKVKAAWLVVSRVAGGADLLLLTLHKWLG